MLFLLTQLGANDYTAIRNGALVGEAMFYGDAIAEIISDAADVGAWNNGWTRTVGSGYAWPVRGVPSNNQNPGLFAFSATHGANHESVSHRTILSGY